MCMVSVVIPYYNSAQTLARALDSVRSQTFTDWEIILVNDGSKDQSEEIVNRYFQNHTGISYKHLIQKNTGPSGARNNGINNANGKYIAFLDSDDAWLPEKLAIQIAFMEKNQDVVITGTNYQIIKETSWPKYPLKPDIIEVDFYRMLFKVGFLTSTVMVRRKVLLKDDIRFRVGKNQAEDLLFFLQILRRYRGVRISAVLGQYFKIGYGESGLSGDLPKLLSNELDNLELLYEENQLNQKKINVFMYWTLRVFYHLKHYKRKLYSTIYKLKS